MSAGVSPTSAKGIRLTIDFPAHKQPFSRLSYERFPALLISEKGTWLLNEFDKPFSLTQIVPKRAFWGERVRNTESGVRDKWRRLY
jgi:hypothetical protein